MMTSAASHNLENDRSVGDADKLFHGGGKTNGFGGAPNILISLYILCSPG